MNMLRIHTACIGNHDLDFGIQQFELLSGSFVF
jgi:2',3'-cyclic-nucleotide 2'-phosphodiesterase (5'-nucleotidase family)